MILKNPDFRQVFPGKSGGCRLGEESIFFRRWSRLRPETRAAGPAASGGAGNSCLAHRAGKTGILRERFNDFKPLRRTEVTAGAV